MEGIPDSLGTAVNVQQMVFGNLGESSGTGVAFTRNPPPVRPRPTATGCPAPGAMTSSPGSANAGGTVAVDTGAAPDADAQPLHHDLAEIAMDLAACVACGACVAACPNGAAQLFTGAKVAHLAALPQVRCSATGGPVPMVAVMERQFGSCTTHGECVTVCPAGIPLTPSPH